MKTEDQQIALAQWAGWNTTPQVLGSVFVYYKEGDPHCHATLPDTSSLDVLHEMEKRLVDQNLWQQYMQKLSEGVCADADEPLNYDIETQWGMIHATAAQRRKAMLIALNLWKEDV